MYLQESKTFKMFAKATKTFVKEIDTDGLLIPVSRLNDSDRLQLLGLVRKKKRLFFWQKPKYYPSSFTLSDVLIGGEALQPVIEESDFTKYEGSYKHSCCANVNSSVATVRLNVDEKSFAKMHSSFGMLRKREVNIPRLLTATQDRKINVAHALVQQTRESGNEILCFLREKVVTVQKCAISEHFQGGGQCVSMLGFNTPSLKVSVKDQDYIKKDSDVDLEIPADTVIAYNVIELSIGSNGEFEFCLVPEKPGGFKKASTEKPPMQDSQEVEVDANPLLDAGSDDSSAIKKVVPSETPLSALKEDWSEIKKQLQPLVDLPEDRRSALFRIYCELLYQGEVVALLENMLDDLSSNEKPDMTDLKDLKSSEKQIVTDLLQLLEIENEQPSPKESAGGKQELVTAAHYLLSAMEEMSDAGLAVFGTCCELQVVPALCYLLTSSSADGMCYLEDPALSPLSDEGKFNVARRLFSVTDIDLDVSMSTIKAVTVKEPGFLPLLLCIVLYGFALLSGNT